MKESNWTRTSGRDEKKGREAKGRLSILSRLPVSTYYIPFCSWWSASYDDSAMLGIDILGGTILAK
jgi:hypothetical protein